MREYATSREVAINILKAGADALPTVIHPYCLNKKSCPMPTEPKPVVKIDSPMLARKCSKCKMTGHNKLNCTK